MTSCACSRGESHQLPAFGYRPRVSRWPRPHSGLDDNLNTAQSVGLMREFAAEDSQAPEVIQAASEVTAHARSPLEAASAIHPWIRKRVRYVDDAALVSDLVRDPEEAEVLIRPVDLLGMASPQGDCDDFAMLAAAMLLALDIPASFVTIEADPQTPGQYSHVYTVAHTADGELTIDASHGPYPGWTARRLGKIRYWPLRPAKGKTAMARVMGAAPDLTDPDIVEILAEQAGTWNPNTNSVDVSAGSTPWGGWDAITAGIQSASKILGTRYAVPQLAPGQVISTRTAQGTTYLSQGVGAPNYSGGISGFGFLLPIALLGVLAFVVLDKN